MRPWTAEQGADGGVSVTAIVLTRDEEVNIKRCLSTLGWADQVVVVDSGSTDRTVELACAQGAEILTHPFDSYGAQRAWAIAHPSVRNSWVMFVDADEWVSDELAAEVATAVATDRYAGYRMRLRLVFQGRWIRHAGWYAGSWVIRLARRDAVNVVGTVSERLVASGPIGRLRNDIIDEDRKPLERWLAKHNRYSSMQAEERRRLRAVPVRARIRASLRSQPRRRAGRELIKQLVLPSVPATSVLLFLYLYIVKLGVLDGRQGLDFCLLHSFNEFVVRLKMRESNR